MIPGQSFRNTTAGYSACTCVMTANTSAGEGQETEPRTATTDQDGECVDTNTKSKVVETVIVLPLLLCHTKVL